MNLTATLTLLTLTVIILVTGVVLTALAYPVLAFVAWVKELWVTRWVCYWLGRGVRWYWRDYLNFGRRKR